MSLQAQQESKYWVFFTDKNQSLAKMDIGPETSRTLGISHRAEARRRKVLAPSNIVNNRDLPVRTDYKSELNRLGVRIVGESRWLNGVSAHIVSDRIEAVYNLPFVRSIQRVRHLKQKPVGRESIPPQMKASRFSQTSHLLDYGLGYDQVSQIHVPEVHDLGIDGRGVLIGVIDTGFDHANRPIFAEMDILSEYDFHWGDEITANEDNDPSTQHNHGTEVLSVVGGYLPGALIGPAYRSTFALAKTEWVPTSDLAIEEDHWIMAIEWLENHGADIVTSSVSYVRFLDKTDYTQDDLDGDTGLVTIAADIAAGKGVVVLNSAGNKDFWSTINFPADGDSVIAVGAVSNNGILASFSSEGPTADGRIKPDVMAMGVGVVAINPSSKLGNEFLFTNGTSFSTPLAAGVCALILEAHPELGPMDVREALRETAHQSDSPNNQFGWGIINAYEAVFYHGMVFTNFERLTLPAQSSESLEVDVLVKSGVPDSVRLHYQSLSGMNAGQIQMTSVGDNNSRRYRAVFPQYLDLDNLQFYITAHDDVGDIHFGPVGAPERMYSFSDSNRVVSPSGPDSTAQFALYQNYPNPFQSATQIRFDLIRSSYVRLSIFDIRGRLVITLLDRQQEIGKKQIAWLGLDKNGHRVPPGIYFIRLKTEENQAVRKMIYVH